MAVSATIQASAKGQNVQLLGGGIVRPFNVGAFDWKAVRLSFRAWVDRGGALGIAGFGVGLCSGSSAPYDTAADVTNFVGWEVPPTASAATYANSFVLPSARVIRKYGSTTSAVSNIGTRYMSTVIGYITGFAVDVYRVGSGSERVSVFAQTANAGTTEVANDALWLGDRFVSIMSVPNHAVSGPLATALLESTYGTLDHINIYWGNTDWPMCIEDLQVTRLL